MIPVSRRRSLQVLLIFVASVLLSVTANAQLTVGHVTGHVQDNSGALVSGAHVILTNEATGVSANAISTSTGTYTFEQVNPGTYTVRVEATGFAPQVAKGLQVHIQESITQDYSLAVGDVSQQVTVETAAPLLQSESASVGQVVDSKAINDLPLVGRDWTTLAHLAAGTTTTGSNGSAGNGGASGLSFSANGVNATQNDFRLDGIDDNMEFYGGFGTISIQGTTSIVPPPDAIQEFNLQTGDLSAAFGHSTGSVVNAVIKSGGDQFHGDLWEYLRNDAFNANDFFANLHGTPRPAYHEHQFGGTVGGPVRVPGTKFALRKTFFFFDTQRVRLLQPVPHNSSVPTAAMQNSRFTNLQDLFGFSGGTHTDGVQRIFPNGTVFDPATTRIVRAGARDTVSGLTNTSGADVNIRDPFYQGSVAGISTFVGKNAQLNMLPASRLDPNAIKILRLYPDPSTSGLINNFYTAPDINLTLNQYDIRIDHNLNDTNLLWGVFNWYHAFQTTPGALPGLAFGATYGGGTDDSPHYATAFSYTHIFTPTLTNSLNVGVQSSTNLNVPPNGNTPGIPASFGIQGESTGPGLGGLPQIVYAGSTFTTLGFAGYNPVTNNVTSYEIQETLTKLYKSHTFNIGYEITDIRARLRQPTAGAGTMTFNGQFTDVPGAATGATGVADMLLTPTASSIPAAAGGFAGQQGGVSAFTKSTAATIHNTRFYNAVYLQDDWKILPSLTLNLGMRWDHYGAPYENNDRQANMIGANGGNGPGGNYYIPNSTCGQATPLFQSLLTKDGIALTCSSTRALSDIQKANFAPRVGFAYRVRPDFVIRAGYGIAYGALANIGAAPYVLGNNFPFVFSITQTAASPVAPVVLNNGQLPTLENVFASVDITNPANANPSGSNLAGRVFSYQTPYTQTYNLTLQKQIGRHDSVQAAYVGNVGRHLDARGTNNVPSVIAPPGTSLTANTTKFPDGTTHSLIPYPDFAVAGAYLTTNATSSYNSLQTIYTHQLSAGLAVLANYTYSKCMTDLASITDGITYRAQWLPGFGISRDYTLCPNDAKHVVHISGSYDLPFGRGRQFGSSSNLLEQSVLGGWGLNYILTYQSGQPFTITCLTATTTQLGCNGNKVPGVSQSAGAHKYTQWLNPAAFAAPPRATAVGQMDYSPLGGISEQGRGPAFTNMDASVFKEFPIRESVHLQFRAEAYNVFNHTQFANPSSGNQAGNSNFTVISATRNAARIMQFALKLYY